MRYPPRILSCIVFMFSSAFLISQENPWTCHTGLVNDENNSNSQLSCPECSCWPDHPVPTTQPCVGYEAFLPDPSDVEAIDLKYVKVIVHIFQKEDPNNPGQPHPTDPQNWNIHANNPDEDHLAVIKSWYQSPDGLNKLLAGLCDDPGDFSPHIEDSRVRFLLEYGEVGKDIFFHANNRDWGTSAYRTGPNNQHTASNSRSFPRRYINGGSNGNSWDSNLSQNYINWMSQPQNQNSMHVFISRTTWIDLNGNGQPDGSLYDQNGPDAYSPYSGGYIYRDQAICVSSPYQVIFGSYEQYLRYYLGDEAYFTMGGVETGVLNPDGPVSLGNGSLGEVLHIFGIDHVDGDRAHFGMSPSVDGCLDTPTSSSYVNNGLNRLGNNFGFRCALTQCQIGRIHSTIANSKPAWIKYSDENGNIVDEPQPVCSSTIPEIVIQSGEDIDWNSPRNLKSGVVVKTGAKLTITCDIGFPEDAGVIVEPGGRLEVLGAKLYSNCEATFWKGISIEGYPFINDPALQGICYLEGAQIETAVVGVQCQPYAGDPQVYDYAGGIIEAESSTFLNCQTYGAWIRLNFDAVATGQGNYFSDCNFTQDSDYYGSTVDFIAGIYLDGAKDVNITQCDFANTYPAIEAIDRGYGVFMDAGGARITRSSFEGFWSGIHTSFRLDAAAINMENNIFENNYIGASIVNADNCRAINNTVLVGSDFPIPDDGINDPANIGFYIFSSTDFIIEQNSFDRYQGAGTINPVGILCRSVGNDLNDIYLNDFKNLKIGNLSNGVNRGTDDFTGLKYSCNNNGDSEGTSQANEFDFAVADGGVSFRQGAPNSDARNTFSKAAPINLQFENAGLPVNYYWRDDEPTLHTPPPAFAKIFTEIGNSCLPRTLQDPEEEYCFPEAEEQHFINLFLQAQGQGRIDYHAASRLIGGYLCSGLGNYDTVRTWLANSGTLIDYFRLVDTWLAEGNTTEAQAALQNIPAQFQLPPGDMNYLLFEDLKNRQIGAIQAGQSEEAMVTSQPQAFINIADAGDYEASAQAKDLVNRHIAMTYYPVVKLPNPTSPNGGSSNLQIGDVSEDLLSDKLVSLDIQPNPVLNTTTFTYRIPEHSMDNAEIILTDLNGRTVRTWKLDRTVGNIRWETANVEGGVYLLRLVSGEEATATKRVIVIE